MSIARAPFAPADGRFYRAVPPDRAATVLDPPAPGSAGRYHRPGQPALYMSPRLDWARIAVSGYMREDGRPRLVLPLRVSGARVVDLRDPRAAAALGVDPARAALPWRPALAEGGTPPSWSLSDAARASGADGLIDISRHIPGGWHLVLFRWNDGEGPGVRRDGDPVEVRPRASGPKWG